MSLTASGIPLRLQSCTAYTWYQEKGRKITRGDADQDAYFTRTAFRHG
jgi:hypothetical protein